MTDSGRDRDEEELAALLADLERTLTELRSAIDADVRRRDEESSDDRRRLRRPPTPGEILRFTEEYTIPTLISLLEATVRSLELLRAVLRIAGPNSLDGGRNESGTASDRPDAGVLRDALTDLRDALAGAELPQDSAAGDIVAEARDLTEEIDGRLADDRSDGSESNGGARSDRTDGIEIDVSDEGEMTDVDAELASIKESLSEEEANEETTDDCDTIDE